MPYRRLRLLYCSTEPAVLQALAVRESAKKVGSDTEKMTKSEALRQAQLSLLRDTKFQRGDEEKRADGLKIFYRSAIAQERSPYFVLTKMLFEQIIEQLSF
ncbi:hypothetical protein F7734_40085 [Scytonema sp. UIC 10036]|uniref:hypothetical protein n=1 Tax=Scytonema sp. UIC 10036 TaxID=2304196 RepID=UPI0012DA2C41|nr:hypothetical protein [Scytonema sp. UIC 10036]MUG98180.1 hypothetical protein [Scytonema sp. UIC 10036]